LYKKPKSMNGVGIMLVAGAVGTFADLVYGYGYACKPYVTAWEQLQAEKMKKIKSSLQQQE